MGSKREKDKQQRGDNPARHADSRRPESRQRPTLGEEEKSRLSRKDREGDEA